MRLDLNHLDLSFGETPVLNGLSADPIDCGTLALIGPSGGGKSTLLRVIAGLLIPDAGEIRLDGDPLPKNEDALREYRKRVGTVFQSYNLFLHLDALTNLVLPMTVVHGVPPIEAESRAMELLERFRLTDHAYKRPRELSGGQQQRVAILRALAIRPRLVLLDEPTSALDPEMAAQVLDMVAELADEGIPVILVTHQLAFAKSAADTICFLHQGRIQAQSSADEFFTHPPTEASQRFVETVLKY